MSNRPYDPKLDSYLPAIPFPGSQFKIGDTIHIRKPQRFTVGVDPGVGDETVVSSRWHFDAILTPQEDPPVVRALCRERERLIQQWEAMTHRNWVAEQRERTILENYLRLQDMTQAIHEFIGWGAYVPRP